MVKFSVNGEKQLLDVEADMPLLWVLRDELGLTGTKFGCGVAFCGACTVHVNGVAVRSCVTLISAQEEQQVTTIEGLTDIGQEISPNMKWFVCPLLQQLMYTLLNPEKH